VVAFLALESRVAGLHMAEDDGIFKGDNSHSMTFFGGEVKPSVPCCKML
jgi:hypothetical protein